SSLPSGMLGLTALAFSPTPGMYGYGQYGWAGALGQLWKWKDGAFDGERVDATHDLTPRPATCFFTAAGGTSPCPPAAGPVPDPRDIENEFPAAVPADFRYRVRDIRAQANANHQPLKTGRFLAVTAGCAVGSTCDMQQASVDPSNSARPTTE